MVGRAPAAFSVSPSPSPQASNCQQVPRVRVGDGPSPGHGGGGTEGRAGLGTVDVARAPRHYILQSSFQALLLSTAVAGAQGSQRIGSAPFAGPRELQLQLRSPGFGVVTVLAVGEGSRLRVVLGDPAAARTPP